MVQELSDWEGWSRKKTCLSIRQNRMAWLIRKCNYLESVRERQENQHWRFKGKMAFFAKSRHVS